MGLDFGTESVRAVLVSLAGEEVGTAVKAFDHGVITGALPGDGGALAPAHVAQHAGDWVEGAGAVAREVLATTGVDKVIFDQCQLGLRDRHGGILQKTTGLVSNAPEILAQFVNLRCPGRH